MRGFISEERNDLQIKKENAMQDNPALAGLPIGSDIIIYNVAGRDPRARPVPSMVEGTPFNRAFGERPLHFTNTQELTLRFQNLIIALTKDNVIRSTPR
jgi:hypothetical protein